MSVVRTIAVVGTFSFLSLAFTNCSGNFTVNSGGLQVEVVETPQDPPSNPPDQEQNKGLQDNRSLTCDVQPVTITHSPNFVDLNKYPLAVCNDGSPAVYSVREGFGAGKNRWVMYLEGGASCVDQESCTERSIETPDLLSSKAYINEPLNSQVGVISPDPLKNPDLYDATVVHIHYCSSDGCIGNKVGDSTKPGVIPDSWHFQGHEIVKAVVHSLQDKYGFNQATEFLLAGSSAVGAGVFNNVSWISQNIPASVRFVASTDAGYDVNESNGVSKQPGTPYDILNPIQKELWNASGDIFCEAKAVTEQDHINCAKASLSVAKDTGSLRVPIFIRQALADGVQLKGEGLDIQSNPPKAQSQGYQAFFAQSMRDSLNNANNFVSVFAAASNVHGQMDNTDYFKKTYTFTVNGTQQTLAIVQALGIWYKDPCQLKKWMQ